MPAGILTIYTYEKILLKIKCYANGLGVGFVPVKNPVVAIGNLRGNSFAFVYRKPANVGNHTYCILAIGLYAFVVAYAGANSKGAFKQGVVLF